MRNRIISLARSIWYDLSEPVKLRFLRGECLQTDPLVSVIIPTHNRADLLVERCLKSVLSQTYKNIEIIVIGHGCTDGTLLAVARLWLKDKRIKYFPVERKETYPPTLENHWFAGRVVPANEGYKHCSGSWTAQNDDDDEWTEDHIETLLRFAQKNDYEFVSGAHEANGISVPPYDLDGVKIGGVQTWLYRSYLNHFKWNPDCWRKDHDRVCDTDLQARFRKAGVRMGYINKIVTIIRPRPGNSTVGSAAARENEESYMRHLAFK